MKTITLILCLACLGAWAQTPTNTDDATKDAALRNALHNVLGGASNAPVTVALDGNNGSAAAGSAVTPPSVTNAGSVPPVPPLPARRQPRGAQGFNPSAFSRGTNKPATNAVVGAAAPVTAVPVVPASGVAVPPPGAINPAAVAVPPNTPPAAAAVAPGASPAPVQPEQILQAGTIDFPKVDLETILPFYAELVGRTILHAQLPQVQISLRTQTALTKTEAIQALDSVLAMNGIAMVNVGEKFVKAVPQASVFTTAAPFTTHDISEIPEADQYITHIAQLKYAKPSELVQTLAAYGQIPNGIQPIDSSQILVIRDYSGNVKRMLELIKKIDVDIPMEWDSEVIPIKYAQAQDIATALSSLGGGTGTTVGHGATTGQGGSGRTGGLGGMGGTGGLGGYNPNSGGLGTTGGINNPSGGAFGSNPAARKSSFSDRLNNIINKAAGSGDFQVLGQTKIIADARTNSLLVFANKQDMEMIKKIIKELDVVLPQVLIEAIIMEVSLDNSRDVGFSYLQTSPTSAGHGYFNGIGGLNNGTILNPGSFNNAGTNGIPSGFSYFGQFGNDFSATATAIATDGRITVLSRPRIQTSHGVAANLQVGDTVPEITGTYFNGLGSVGSSSQYQQTFVGINLEVTPLINTEGLVVMDIVQDVEQLGTPTTIDGNPVPTTSKRYAQATVSVKDRDTIILGGMISTTKSSTHSGVPFLKDIPALGYLFRSSSDSKQRKELIVLIRPTVLPTPEQAALVATHERAKLPGVKAAEREIQIDENARLKEADKIKVPKERD